MATTKKMLGSVGVSALCGHVRSIKQTANAAANGVLQLSDALNQSITEIEAVLNDILSTASITILPTDWTQNTTIASAYQYYYDIINAEVTAADLPIVSVAPNSLETTAACELCPTCESMAGKVRLYSKSRPENNIVINCWVVKGTTDDN